MVEAAGGTVGGPGPLPCGRLRDAKPPERRLGKGEGIKADEMERSELVALRRWLHADLASFIRFFDAGGVALTS